MARPKKRGAFIFSSAAAVFPAVFELIYNSNNDQNKVPQSHDHNNGPRTHIPRHEPYELLLLLPPSALFLVRLLLYRTIPI